MPKKDSDDDDMQTVPEIDCNRFVAQVIKAKMQPIHLKAVLQLLKPIQDGMTGLVYRGDTQFKVECRLERREHGVMLECQSAAQRCVYLLEYVVFPPPGNGRWRFTHCLGNVSLRFPYLPVTADHVQKWMTETVAHTPKKKE